MSLSGVNNYTCVNKVNLLHHGDISTWLRGISRLHVSNIEILNALIKQLLDINTMDKLLNKTKPLLTRIDDV